MNRKIFSFQSTHWNDAHLNRKINSMQFRDLFGRLLDWMHCQNCIWNSVQIFCVIWLASLEWALGKCKHTNTSTHSLITHIIYHRVQCQIAFFFIPNFYCMCIVHFSFSLSLSHSSVHSHTNHGTHVNPSFNCQFFSCFGSNQISICTFRLCVGCKRQCRKEKRWNHAMQRSWKFIELNQCVCMTKCSGGNFVFCLYFLILGLHLWLLVFSIGIWIKSVKLQTHISNQMTVINFLQMLFHTAIDEYFQWNQLHQSTHIFIFNAIEFLHKMKSTI